MAKQKTKIDEIKWVTRQRLQYIELMAFYAGVITRSDIAKAFAISDAAATKDLNFYSEVAPDNLIYKHSVFGFVPSTSFREVFANLTPAVALSTFEANFIISSAPNIDNHMFGIPTSGLTLPNRLPKKSVLAQITRSICSKKKLKVSFAESCTGGLLAQSITSISGASKVFNLSVVTYSNNSKSSILNVPKKIINKFGAVSEECCLSMVKNLAKISKSQINVSITGIAGPKGGSKFKPVGLVFIGIKYKGKNNIYKYLFANKTRRSIQNASAKAVVDNLLNLIK